MGWRNKLRDWFRGYSDDDWEYAKWVHFERKRGAPGEVIPLSAGQYKAYRALSRAIYG